MTKSERLLQIQGILLAHPQGLTKAEIARKLGVTRYSVMRYIDELSVLIPIWEGERGIIGLQTEGFLKSLGLTDERDISEDLSRLISEGESNVLLNKL